MKMKNDVPLLLGTTSKDGKRIQVWCPFCRVVHHHGWSQGDKKISHRGAHCTIRHTDIGSYGYYIKPAIFNKNGELSEINKKPRRIS